MLFTNKPVEPVILEGLHCRMVIARPGPDVVLLSINGSDIGELGEAPFRILGEHLPLQPCHFFIDSRGTKGASIEVSQAWAQWLMAKRGSFTRITMLCGSRFIEITAEFVRRFANLGGLMRLTTHEAAFDKELSAACGNVIPEFYGEID